MPPPPGREFIGGAILKSDDEIMDEMQMVTLNTDLGIVKRAGTPGRHNHGRYLSDRNYLM